MACAKVPVSLGGMLRAPMAAILHQPDRRVSKHGGEDNGKRFSHRPAAQEGSATLSDSRLGMQGPFGHSVPPQLAHGEDHLRHIRHHIDWNPAWAPTPQSVRHPTRPTAQQPGCRPMHTKQGRHQALGEPLSMAQQQLLNELSNLFCMAGIRRPNSAKAARVSREAADLGEGGARLQDPCGVSARAL